MLNKNESICIISFFGEHGDNGKNRIIDLYNIFKSFSKKMFIISNIYTNVGADHTKYTIIKHYILTSNMIFKILHAIYVQIKTTIELLKILKNVNVVFWGIGTSHLVLPMMVARLFNKKNILFIGGRGAKEIYFKYNNKKIIYCAMNIMEKGTYNLASKLVTNADHILKDVKTIYCNKVYKYPICFRNIDTKKFHMFNNLNCKKNIIGYVGRLSEEKGIKQLVEAIIKLQSICPDLCFYFAGDGPLYSYVESSLSEEIKTGKVRLLGWISHDDLCNFYNEIKLLIIPSYTEGLPTAALESMACGTPVVANPVGGIPEIIKHNYSGFLLKDNKPQSICIGVQNALQHSNIYNIALNARYIVNYQYSFDSTIKKITQVLSNA